MPSDPDLAAAGGSRRFALASLSRRLGVAGFLHWWGAQLAPLVPGGARTAIARRRARPVLAFETDRATLYQPTIKDGRLTMVERAQVPLTGEAGAVAAAGRAAIAQLGLPDERRVVVALAPRQLLRRTLTLPSAVEENLKQALTYDLDRHTPFKADELYFDATVIGRDAARGQIRVDLAAARRSFVDQALRHAQSFGATVSAVVPDAQAGSASQLNLLPRAGRRATGPWNRWQFWLPIALLALVTLAAVVLPLWQKRSYTIALMRATDEARAQAAVSESLRTELDRLTGDYNFALERKYQFPAAVDVLNEVTRLLPDDTWLLQMEVKSGPRSKEPQRELLLRGESANAGRLISAFEESKVFTQAAPRSPTTKIQPGPGEIFDLGAQVRVLPAPAPLRVEASVPASDGAPTASPTDAPGASAPPPAAKAEAATPAKADAGPKAAAPTSPPQGAPPPASGGTPSSQPIGTPGTLGPGVAPNAPAGGRPVMPAPPQGAAPPAPDFGPVQSPQPGATQ